MFRVRAPVTCWNQNMNSVLSNKLAAMPSLVNVCRGCYKRDTQTSGQATVHVEMCVNLRLLLQLFGFVVTTKSSCSRFVGNRKYL